MNKTHKIVKYSVISLSIVVFLLGFGLLCLVMCFLMISSSDNSEETEYQKLQQYMFNPNTNETYFGIVTTPENLISGSSMFSSHDDGWLNLISPFGHEEYTCTGTCFCDEEVMTKRRVGSVPIHRGLRYLVAALTTAVAIELAKEHFEDECKKLTDFDDSCTRDNIYAEVDACENVYMSASKSKKKAKTKNKQNVKGRKKESHQGNKSRYICSGSCVLNNPSQAESVQFSWGKKMFSLWQRIRLVSKFVTKRFTCDKLFLEAIEVKARDLEKAKDRFIYGPLNMYCFQNSIEKFKQTTPKGEPQRIYSRSMCAGGGSLTGALINRSVLCRKVELLEE